MNGLINRRKLLFTKGLVAAAALFSIMILPEGLTAVKSQSDFIVVDNPERRVGNRGVKSGSGNNDGQLEYDTDRPGQDFRDFDLQRPDVELCRSACNGDGNCRAFTYVKPGVQGASARCWLKSGVPAAARNSCCISGVKAVSGGRPDTQVDLTGTWHAAVSDNTGRWDYTLSLARESSKKWTGTMTVTLDGKSPSTTDVSIESLGGGRISFVWRPGRPNAQQFEGTAAKDRISVSGFGGQLVFTRR